MIDHPRQIGWDIDTDTKIESDNGSEARLRARLEPGQVATVTVTETTLSDDALVLDDIEADALLAWSHSREIDAETRAIFARLAVLRTALSDSEQALLRIGANIERLVQDQDRVRENLSAVPDTSDLAKTYLARMAKLDTDIAKENARRVAAEEAVEAARQAYRKAIQSF
jgi:hypothetical protein